MSTVVAHWHEVVRARDPSLLADLLADDVVFHSPVVHTPQRGKAIASMYLGAALRVFGAGDFRYVREIVGARDAMLEFVVALDGIEINGVDILCWNDALRIVDFKVMLRPLKAIQLIHQRMGELLAAGQANRPAGTQ